MACPTTTTRPQARSPRSTKQSFVERSCFGTSSSSSCRTSSLVPPTAGIGVVRSFPHFQSQPLPFHLSPIFYPSHPIANTTTNKHLVLWSSTHAQAWQVGILCIVFFGFVWVGFLFLVSKYLKAHSWSLPLIACGLGAPRWAQIWWGISGIGYFLPWVSGGYVGGALASRSLWLWLGVLDSIQGLGFGIILLQTLTRTHMLFTLICSQVLGSIATIAARGFGPNKLGPGPISPDPTFGVSAVANAWFWVGLFCQLIIWYVNLNFPLVRWVFLLTIY